MNLSKLAPAARALHRSLAQLAGANQALRGDATPADEQRVYDVYAECFAKMWTEDMGASNEYAQRIAKAALANAPTESHECSVGLNPFVDMAQLTPIDQRAVVFDIGAHIGQSVRALRRYLPTCVIHSFEPVPDTFDVLARNTSCYDDVVVNNAAVGERYGSLEIIESTDSTMSSVLEFGPASWGKERARHSVPVLTIDRYCDEHMIRSIDILKIDTQGYELQVLRGALDMLERGAVRLVYAEVIFAPMYHGMASFDQLYAFLRKSGYSLVAIYDVHYRNGRAGWTDVLFAYEPEGGDEVLACRP